MKRILQDETIEELLIDMEELNIMDQYGHLPDYFMGWFEHSYFYEGKDLIQERFETIQYLYEAHMLTPEQIEEIKTIDEKLLAGKFPYAEEIYEFIKWLKDNRLK